MPASALFQRNIIFVLLVLISAKRLSKPQDLVQLKALGNLLKFIHPNGPRICDDLVCSMVPYHYTSAYWYGVSEKKNPGYNDNFPCF
jgi:hypothetical protein